MAAQSPSNDEIRAELTSILRDDQSMPFTEAVQRWRVRSGRAMDEGTLSRLQAVYLEEQSARLAANPEAMERWTATLAAAKKAAAEKPESGWTQMVARTFVGLATLFAVMSLSLGPSTAVSVLAVAIICTAGGFLLLILPLCFAIGWIVLSTIEGIHRVVTRAA